MTCRFLGCIGHCWLSPLTVLLTVIPIYLVHPAAGSALSSPPALDSYIDIHEFLNDARFRKGQYGARVVDLAARQSLLDRNGDALLIPASTTKPVTNTVAFSRLSPRCRLRT